MAATLLTWLFRLLGRLPLPLLHNLGAVAGWLVWWSSPTYRRHFRHQIERAGLAQYRRAAIAETGRAAFELPAIWLSSHADAAARVVRLSGWEHVEAGMAAGKGVLLLTPHIGCFEVAAAYCATRVPITVLYRRPKADWLEPLIEQGRGSRFTLAPADLTGVRRMLKALRAGEAVGMLPDQVPGNGEGVWAPFFGQPAYTMTLAARLAQTGAAVVLTVAERLPYGAGYHLWFRPLRAPLAGDAATAAAQLNAELEQVVRDCPTQYFWGYNRYKTPAGVAPPA